MSTTTTQLAIVVVVVGLFAVAAAVVDLRQWSTIVWLREKVATRDGIIDEKSVALHDLEAIAVNLRHQCDNLIVENARLRVLLGEKTEYAEELALDLAKATGIDPPEPAAKPVYDLGYLSLPLEVQRELEHDWHERHLGPSGDRP
jgi:hypothetical protein